MLDPSFVTGAPNWADLGTPDVDAATTFYQGLFGWELVRGGPETGGYGMYQLRGRTVAGVMAVAEDQGTPAWSVYFQTPDADATARTVEKAGGTAAFPPMDVLDYGRMGGFTDNGGAYFGVWQPGTNTGLGMIMEPGSLIWSELYTPDVPAAAAFFHTVFGWQTDDMAFPGGSYTMVRPAGDNSADSSFGGLVPIDDVPSQAAAGPHWLPYFAVDDCDAAVATVERLGGTVTMAAMDVPDVGRIATFADPAGAAFAVIKPAPMPQS
ncbi:MULTISPECIES: VOC family protein [Streptomyces]|uniref:Enzyme related to lactoylglutathione lyase n=1 Tax=Streptomyces clavifer TaxID=68188 RepID=A0ABS4V1U7_9ACTN|nr:MULTISPECIES: VOC family protein [Streptomyces]KQX92931.1 hydroxylase [Streptomyces sp. Root1319]KQZ17406.1 hydroxylase [Streptomyces sp. Root55]MBP2357776.1 putative enzyme related to lactoylglutathione lyase [Streptomyces clavifer]MDX2742551.1 VOC family protein [Streptomyces sp. NRRL_B-2557]MDX3062844.1 VOC family protein [Streptomyces sp. ND04-05B]